MPFSMIERLAATIIQTDRAGLDALSRGLSACDSGLSDDAAHLAFALIQARRGAPAPRRSGPVVRIPAPRSPDKGKSIARRRRCAASGAVPAKIAAGFTQAETAVLATIAGEVRRKGSCQLCNDAIAALAGVCRTIVQNTLRLAKVLGLIRVQERRRRGAKNLPNIVTITSPLWRAWLKLDGDRVQKRGHPIPRCGKPQQKSRRKPGAGRARQRGKDSRAPARRLTLRHALTRLKYVARRSAFGRILGRLSRAFCVGR